MATNSTRISADFGHVADAAQTLQRDAKQLINDLEQFKNKIANFVAENWDQGAASEAFVALQAQWDVWVTQLNTTLDGAGKLVFEGNADLQAKDAALAGLFPSL
ncbi:WXG100 family type VII secretion target [Nocardia sp. 2]|uniref:WXG100 family type VII secretion target n=1 Tax=Nocardia acididurans TaxID=2802282 RepID=A0ABS1M3I0_9NOCA|nr:WXG100 family type VII secretion target [Nocardia acididurans]MBL1075125.1 WXG100 family type VII secretion target [Nocardia acididurans]